MGRAIERRFLIVVGEASGDAHAARLVECLNALGPCRTRGVAGPALLAAGVDRLVDMSDLAVVGFSGIVGRLPRIWRAYRRLLAEAERFDPHAAVLVDSPGFNFRIGPELKRRGRRVFYYIAPQVWAWHPERALAMSRWVDRMAVVFPFEEPLFRQANVDATFVGHPLLELTAEVDASTLRAELGAGPADRILGILPGSRSGELKAHLPIMLKAARLLMRGRPDLIPVLPLAPGLDPHLLKQAGLETAAGSDETWAAGSGVTATAWGLRIIRGRTRAVQTHATACAVASGTATLETALARTPLVVIYRVGRLNYAIARRLVRLKHIGLPNIVAQSEVVPELIQDALTPDRLAQTLAPWLDDATIREASRARLDEVRARLGSPGASRRTAALLWEMVA